MLRPMPWNQIALGLLEGEDPPPPHMLDLLDLMDPLDPMDLTDPTDPKHYISWLSPAGRTSEPTK